MTRSFELPTTRTFDMTGTARINTLIPDDLIERLIGQDQIVATSSGRLPGDLQDGAASAVDGNPATVWSPGFGASSQVGSWLQVAFGHTRTVDHLDLAIEADDAHSVPTKLTLTSTSGSETVTLPPIASSRTRGTVVTVPVRFPALVGDYLKVTVAGARLVTTTDYYSGSPIALPVAIAELGIPGVQAPPPPADIPSRCRSDLLSVDGKPVWLRVSGTSTAALAGQGLGVSLCGPDVDGITLGPGRHTLVAANAQTAGTGWNLDQLVLDSAPGGGPEPAAADGSVAAPVPSPAPTVHVVSQTTTSMQLKITGVTSRTAPFHLVLGQNINAGWTATVDGGPSLGAPELIDAFANGWMVHPGALGPAVDSGTLDVTLRWTPQQRVWLALGLSAVTLLGCLVMALWAPLRRRRRPARHSPTRRPPAGAPAGDAVAAEASVASGAAPTLASPWTSEGVRPPWWQVAAGAVGAGVLAAAIASPTVGVAVGVAVAVSLSLRRARWLLTLAAFGLLAVAAASVVVDQATSHLPAGADWPASFTWQVTVTWAAVACLGADAVVQVLRRAGRDRR
jgi:hypothetical protein